MDVETLQKEIARLDPEEQEGLLLWIRLLQLKRKPEFWQEQADRAADTNPDHWMTLDELKRKLDAQ